MTVGSINVALAESVKLTYVRMYSASTILTVIEPKLLSAGALQGILRVGVDNGQLTLLVEPGRYDTDGFARWYMGNGNSTEPYVYLHQFPIQTFVGSWRCIDVNTNGECDEGEVPFLVH